MHVNGQRRVLARVGLALFKVRKIGRLGELRMEAVSCRVRGVARTELVVAADQLLGKLDVWQIVHGRYGPLNLRYWRRQEATLNGVIIQPSPMGAFKPPVKTWEWGEIQTISK